MNADIADNITQHNNHIPLVLTVNVNDIPTTVSNDRAANKEFNAKLDWSSLTKNNLVAYYNNTDKHLSDIHLPKGSYFV